MKNATKQLSEAISIIETSIKSHEEIIAYNEKLNRIEKKQKEHDARNRCMWATKQRIYAMQDILDTINRRILEII